MKALRIALGLTLMGTIPAHIAPAAAQEFHAGKADLARFTGRWQIDPARTKMGRNGPAGDNILRSTSFTFVFSPAGNGLKMDVYAEWPQSGPTRSMGLVTDGVTRTCPDPTSCMTKGGVAAEQAYSWRQLAPGFLVRLFSIKGKPYDYSTLSLSADGQTLSLISWDPATPQYQNAQVFTRQP